LAGNRANVIYIRGDAANDTRISLASFIMKREILIALLLAGLAAPAQARQAGHRRQPLPAGSVLSPNGKTPAATLYAAMTHEMKIKGSQARFQKSARGQFAYQAPSAT
jgi:hypothetical protein